GVFGASAPQAFSVIQDSQPPSLFIDFPSTNIDLTSATNIVAGRVGDMLSGFMGLQVMISIANSNGTRVLSANVDVGIGNNGTYEQQMVFALGTNLVTVTASDAHGNTIQKQAIY